jgi:hypothetical protein
LSVSGERAIACGRDGTRDAGAGRAAWAAWWLAGAALAVLVPTAPAAWLAADPVACAFRQATGVECPTCGLTRAFAALAQGAWRESLALHPWALALALQAAAAWVLWAAWLARWLPARPDRWVPQAVTANLGALVVLWLARLLARS